MAVAHFRIELIDLVRMLYVVLHIHNTVTIIIASLDQILYLPHKQATISADPARIIK